jgi:hypothetical protein
VTRRDASICGYFLCGISGQVARRGSC